MKPSQATIDRDEYKRQLKMLEFYLLGRTRQLANIGETSPGEKPACDMAHAELQTILSQVLPEMREVLK